MRLRHWIFVLALVFQPEGGLPAVTPAYAGNELKGLKKMRINIVIGDRKIPASLNDSQASKDFVGLLPLTLELKDYASKEKVSDLPAKLSVVGSPEGSSARKGDIAFYAPWGNLAIFYHDHGFASGLIKLGQLDDADALPVQTAPWQARFEIAADR